MGNETSSSSIIVDKSQRISSSSNESNPVKIRLKPAATTTNRKNISKNNNDDKQAFTDDRQTKSVNLSQLATTPNDKMMISVTNMNNDDHHHLSSSSLTMSPQSHNSASSLLMMMSSSLDVPHSDRRRSKSLCAVAADQSIITDDHLTSSTTNHRQHHHHHHRSNNPIAPLSRLRIQTSFRQVKVDIGESILKRAMAARVDIRQFIARLGDADKTNRISRYIYDYLVAVVDSIDDIDEVAHQSIEFGGRYAQLVNYGFKADFFSSIADSITAECVNLDRGTHKKCETFLAWSQLITIMFSSVRDGFYIAMRTQRRGSLPQQTRYGIVHAAATSANQSIDHDSQ